MNTLSPRLFADCLFQYSHLEIPEKPPVSELEEFIFSRSRSNELLSISEHEKISAFVTKISGTIDEYNETIDGMERLLARLKNTRDNLRRQFNNARTLIAAPIRKLPPDILHEIFLMCGDEDGYRLSLTDDSWHRAYISCPTLKFSWVCSYWQKCIQYFPKLWSSFRLSSRAFRARPGSFQIFLKYWVYSGNHLVDFHYEGDDYSWTNSHSVDEALDILLSNTTRWRRAVFEMPTTSAQQWLTHATSRLNLMSASDPSRNQFGHFPALEVLEIPQGLSRPDELAPFFRTLSVCPRLQTYQGPSFSWKGHSADFSHLTMLSLVSFVGKSVGHLLCRLPVLERLSLGSFQFSEDADKGASALTKGSGNYSSGLLHLLITTQTLHPAAWRFLSLPSLTTLRIFGVSKSPANMVHLSSMLRDSRCTLRVLEVESSISSMQEVIQDLLHPSLIKLIVVLHHLRDARVLAQLLKRKKDGSRILPRLRSLKLCGGDEYYLELPISFSSIICEIIHSQCMVCNSSTGGFMVSGLQAFTLSIDRSFHFQYSQLLHSRLDALETAGLTVDITV